MANAAIILATPVVPATYPATVLSTPSRIFQTMPEAEIKVYERRLLERVFHGVLFEILAIGIATPLAAWLTGESLAAMGVLSAIISFMAITWNMLFNWMFDQAQKHLQFHRGIAIRILHACLFEIGLIIMAVPFIAWWINTTWIRAFVIDIGLILFFLPYSFFFNLAYDRAREAVLRKRYRELATEKT